MRKRNFIEETELNIFVSLSAFFEVFEKKNRLTKKLDEKVFVLFMKNLSLLFARGILQAIMMYVIPLS